MLKVSPGRIILNLFREFRTHIVPHTHKHTIRYIQMRSGIDTDSLKNGHEALIFERSDILFGRLLFSKRFVVNKEK